MTPAAATHPAPSIACGSASRVIACQAATPADRAIMATMKMPARSSARP
jgi:hypothetical protein